MDWSSLNLRCPACGNAYSVGASACICGCLLEEIGAVVAGPDELPPLEPTGLPPKILVKFWLRLETPGDVLLKGQPTREILVDATPLLIGRRDPSSRSYPEIDLQQLKDYGYASRRHAIVQRKGESLSVTDIPGRETTSVNTLDNAIPEEGETMLKDGDRLIIGETVVFLVIQEETY